MGNRLIFRSLYQPSEGVTHLDEHEHPIRMSNQQGDPAKAGGRWQVNPSPA